MSNKIVVIALPLVLFITAICFAEDEPVIIWEEHTQKSSTIPTSTMVPVRQAGEISDSWEEIIAAIEDGTAQHKYSIGAMKELDLGELGVIHMQLAGFNLDERSDGQGKAPTTWIAKDLIGKLCIMGLLDSTGGLNNKEEWRSSSLRNYLKDGVLFAIPISIRKKMIYVNKEQKSLQGYFDLSSQTTEDILWIPDYDEVFGKEALYYDLFQDNSDSRIRKLEGEAYFWWLRSPIDQDTYRCVDNNGRTSTSLANKEGGVLIGFCL